MAAEKSTFEIRVAIIGKSEAGKRTTLNALLKKDCGSAGMGSRSKQTDIHEINAYHVCTAGSAGSNKENGPVTDLLNIISRETIKCADGEEKVEEVTYAFDVDREIVSMHRDTQFTFVLVPSQIRISETVIAPYPKYITQQWDTFDAVIAVTDGKKGFVEEDSDLLKLVAANMKKKEIPVIVLCNKVDDRSEKIVRHTKKARSKVEKIFGITCDDKNTTNPCFLPVSSLHAYIYRAGSSMTVAQFEEFDKDLVEFIGKGRLGSKNWKKMAHEERSFKTYAILSDSKSYGQAMHDCGFEELMNVLERNIGGEKTQEKIVQKQINLSISKLSPFQTEWISYSIFSAHSKQSKLLAGKVDADLAIANGSFLRHAFWDTFEEYQEGTFKKFTNGFPSKVSVVSDPLQELSYYHKLVVLAKWEGEEQKVVNRMKTFVSRYIQFLIRTEQSSNGNSRWKPYSGISPVDWSIIWRSILLLSFSDAFCKTFGREKVICESLAQESMNWTSNGFAGAEDACPHCASQLEKTKKKPIYPRCKPCGIVFLQSEEIRESLQCIYCALGEVGESFQCKNCKTKHEEFPDPKAWLQFEYSEEGKVVPQSPDKYSRIVHLEILESLDDSNHFGHPIYKYLNFLDSINAGKEKSREVIDTKKVL